ncbi:MAG: phosphohistidine phosphatase SixA [Desulfobulbaceae bacterium]|nr:phosphohistidine phosphatase SixA [Desulfobulbaceae bacterium]
MALFLVQHGISASKDVDLEKELTSQGRVETERIAQVAAGYGIKVGRIVHSGKKRAEQTASIYHHALSLKSPLEVVAGINPLDDVQTFASTINPGLDLMVVGHMPFMQRLVSYLTTGSEIIQVYQFQNSGTVCLSANEKADGEFNWFIKWTLNPNIS